MKDGFIRGAAASIDVLVADPKHNCEKILETIQAADARNVKILVCPELVLTAYTCGDIFLHRCLLDEALVGLNHTLNETAAIDMLVVLGMPLRVECKLYNCAAFLHKGKRSCLPDGPQVGSIAVSPRGDLRMPSDACSALWMREMEKIKETITE